MATAPMRRGFTRRPKDSPERSALRETRRPLWPGSGAGSIWTRSMPTAGGAGKLKTIFQDVFIGAMIAWFAWKDMRQEFGWETGWFSAFWERFHGTVIAITLGITVLITVYSLGVYFYRYRALFRGMPVSTPGDGS